MAAEGQQMWDAEISENEKTVRFWSKFTDKNPH